MYGLVNNGKVSEFDCKRKNYLNVLRKVEKYNRLYGLKAEEEKQEKRLL